MIIVMKPGTSEETVNNVLNFFKNYDVKTDMMKGDECTIIGLIGDTRAIEVEMEKIRLFPGVDKISKVTEPYKKVNRKFHPDNTVIDVGNKQIGGKNLAIIAGPCSVENENQLFTTAESVYKSGAGFLRGGAYKPRTSPYAFSGMEVDGLELLKEAKKRTGLPIVTELTDPRLIDLFEREVDIIQIGARNMQNFALLHEVGKTRKPILLKRGFSAPLEEFLMSAEHIMANGNPNVILCERGVRTNETYTRNTLDLSAIPALKKLSHLPVVVDPSHATGHAWMVPSMAKAAIAAGADGLIIEVHNNPPMALCDGVQSLDLDQFEDLMKSLGKYAELEEREI